MCNFYSFEPSSMAEKSFISGIKIIASHLINTSHERFPADIIVFFSVFALIPNYTLEELMWI